MERLQRGRRLRYGKKNEKEGEAMGRLDILQKMVLEWGRVIGSEAAGRSWISLGELFMFENFIPHPQNQIRC